MAVAVTVVVAAAVHRRAQWQLRAVRGRGQAHGLVIEPHELQAPARVLAQAAVEGVEHDRAPVLHLLHVRVLAPVDRLVGGQVLRDERRVEGDHGQSEEGAQRKVAGEDDHPEVESVGPEPEDAHVDVQRTGHRARELEEVEGEIVVPAHALVHPGAVVVMAEHAAAADGAVLGAQGPYHVAGVAQVDRHRILRRLHARALRGHAQLLLVALPGLRVHGHVARTRPDGDGEEAHHEGVTDHVGEVEAGELGGRESGLDEQDVSRVGQDAVQEEEPKGRPPALGGLHGAHGAEGEESHHVVGRLVRPEPCVDLLVHGGHADELGGQGDRGASLLVLDLEEGALPLLEEVVNHGHLPLLHREVQRRRPVAVGRACAEAEVVQEADC
mmetsp:Transcript_9433/g.27536  ORF Transcript_9433/g.27536 Transcript_9433/m.27536 type:complete len:384 (-) Transcript_9433:565-1716(-)